MSAAPQLYVPDVRCPRCGRSPRIALTARQLEKWKHDPPGELAQTYQCAWDRFPGRKCNAIYPITAGAIQRARELRNAGSILGHDP